MHTYTKKKMDADKCAHLCTDEILKRSAYHCDMNECQRFLKKEFLTHDVFGSIYRHTGI